MYLSFAFTLRGGILDAVLKQNERTFSVARTIRRYSLILTLLAVLFTFFAPRYEAQAMDPVTIAILAPIAIQVGKAMMPYIIKGLTNMGRMGLKAGVEIINIFRLPLGNLQLTLLAPFGMFYSGLQNTIIGFIAPFKMAFFILMMPVAAFGIGL